jgi:serine/threonine protein kinase
MSIVEFEQFQNLEVLEEGEWSSLVKVARTDLEMPFAIKIFKVGEDVDDSQVIRKQALFLNEAEVLARLAHPNIVRFYDLVKNEDGYKGIVLEYLDGFSLEKLKAPVDPEIGAMIAIKVLSAMSYLDRGLSIGKKFYTRVCHGDIKPSNIMITPENVKLVDFGCSCVDPEYEDFLYGSLEFMSPNVLSGGEITWKDDFHSLSLTMFQLIWGWRPYKDVKGEKECLERKKRKLKVPDIIKKSGIGKLFLKGVEGRVRKLQIGEVIQLLQMELDNKKGNYSLFIWKALQSNKTSKTKEKV